MWFKTIWYKCCHHMMLFSTIWYDVKEWCIYHTTRFLLWCVGKLNRYKDTSLSLTLHRLGDEYDKRPTGNWDVDEDGMVKSVN